MKWRRFNQIKGLEDIQGNWQECESVMAKIAEEHFSNLLHSCQPSQIEHIANCMDARGSQEENSMLLDPVSE